MKWLALLPGLPALCLAAPLAGAETPALPASAPAASVTPEGIGPVTRMPLPRFVSLKSETKLRRGPGYDHRVDWVLKRPGMPLIVVAEFDNWRKVVDADGSGGWVHYTRLRGSRTVVVLAPRTTLRAEPDPEARPTAIAEQGVVADLSHCTPDWCEVEAEGHEGWVIKADIWGVGRDEVIE